MKNATAADVAAATVATGSGEGTSPTITFPSDYARVGEAGAAANAVTNKLDDFLKTAAAPSDPPLPESNFSDTFFNGTFDGLKAWSVPGHASACPVGEIRLDYFGQGRSINMDAQCTLLENPDVSSVAQSAFVVLWLIAALLIVLGA